VSAEGEAKAGMLGDDEQKKYRQRTDHVLGHDGWPLSPEARKHAAEKTITKVTMARFLASLHAENRVIFRTYPRGFGMAQIISDLIGLKVLRTDFQENFQHLYFTPYTKTWINLVLEKSE
jgi:hypothetical protein